MAEHKKEVDEEGNLQRSDFGAFYSKGYMVLASKNYEARMHKRCAKRCATTTMTSQIAGYKRPTKWSRPCKTISIIWAFWLT
jgi:hypothetical protein